MVDTTCPSPFVRRSQRCTKILATLGPASSDIDTIRKLYLAGADVFRLNFSHGSHEYHKQTYRNIRQVSREVNKHIGVLADMQGPKLRVGRFEEKGGVFLAEGSTFTFDMKEELGTATRVTLPHREIHEAMEVGDILLINDGAIKVECTAVSEERNSFDVIVRRGGQISDCKGVNVPDRELPLSALTEKDRADLKFAVGELGVDWLALSFVQRPEDIKVAQELCDDALAARAARLNLPIFDVRPIGILAKIEKRHAIESIEDICQEADAIMVARGDLGVEMPLYQLPFLQKKVVAAARAAGKPVVVATQMLESMITCAVPTRAEVSDVSTACYDGADAVMLSAETAVGKYPEAALRIMSDVLSSTESVPDYHKRIRAFAKTAESRRPNETADAIAAAVTQVSEVLSYSKCIVCYTSNGGTAFRISRERPSVPILVITPNIHTARKLTLTWGVQSVHGVTAKSFCDIVNISHAACRANNVAETGDLILITASLPFQSRMGNNTLYCSKLLPEDRTFSTTATATGNIMCETPKSAIQTPMPTIEQTDSATVDGAISRLAGANYVPMNDPEALTAKSKMIISPTCTPDLSELEGEDEA